MPLITDDYFVAYTTQTMDENEAYLPISDAAKSDLARMLKDRDAYTFLTIRSMTTLETVRASIMEGFVVLQRGLAGTKAQTHHKGSCVASVSPTVIAVIKDLVCNYDCCETGDCRCTPVVILGQSNAAAKNVGQPFVYRVTMGGSQPLNVTFDGLPAWAQVVQDGDTVVISGIPTAKGTFPVAMAASNCNGTSVLAEKINIVIND